MPSLVDVLGNAADVAYQKLDDLKKMPFYLSEILP